MKRSTFCVPTSRRQSTRWARVLGMRQPFLLLLMGALACEAPLVSLTPVDPIQPTTGDPARPAGLLLDNAALRSLAERSFSVGERVMLAAATNAPGVRESDVVVRDTSVVGIDGEGMLYALGAGQTWLTWTTAQAADSLLLTVAFSSDAGAEAPEYVAPAAPKASVDVRYPVGRTRGAAVNKSWKVAAGDDLQEALNNAQPGDEVVLASGATFRGNFVLPAKQNAGSDWIIVRAEVVAVAAGTRMSPEMAASAARIITPDQNPALQTANGARRWRLVGFQIEHAERAIYNYGIVVLGRGDEASVALQPTDIVLDRMYVHGSTTMGSSRCIAFNGRSLAVIDSWISECHAKGNDAQGICGWNGSGPFLIENNYIEASGQGVMFGGADPRITNVSPSDITIRRNYIFKPLSWGNSVWTVKAAFELKHGKRVLFEGNVIENHWIDAQAGYAILFQTLADENTSWAWTTVQDVMVRNNVIKNSTGGVDLLARVAYNGGTMPTNPTSRVVFLNNLWQDVGIDPISGRAGRIFMLIADHHDVSLINNTVTLNGRASHAMVFDGAPAYNTTIVNNVFPNSEYGIYGSGLGIGSAAIHGYLPGGRLMGNVLPDQGAWEYPAGNFFPVSSGVTIGSVSSTICQSVKTWISASSFPSGTGANCTALELAVRNVVGPPL